MRFVMTVLSMIVNVYMFVIFIRVFVSWFSRNFDSLGKPYEVLCRITDPYLNWFRRFSFLRLGQFDFSAILGIALLYLVGNIFDTLAVQGTIRIGYILALLLNSVWSVVSVVLGFAIIVLLLRLIAYLSKRNIYSSFWRVIDGISRPLLYRLNRLVFRTRIVRYQTGLLSAMALLLGMFLGGGFLTGLCSEFLLRLPV